MSKLHTILTVLVAVIVVGTVAIPIINEYASGNLEYETVVTDRENTGQAFYMSPSTGSYTLKSDGTAPDMWAVSDSFSLNVAGGKINLTTADQKLSDLIQTDDGSGGGGGIDGDVSIFKVSDLTTFCLTTTGDLYGTGANDQGQQGNGTTTDVTTFTKIASDVKNVYTSNNTTFYVTRAGDLYGTGANDRGQQGNGTTTDVTTFTKVASDVADVALSDVTSFYITESGDLYGTGANDQGQQGNGTTTDVTTFTKIASDVSSVNVSNVTSFYIVDSTALFGTGANDRGQQGNGTGNTVLEFTFLAQEPFEELAVSDTWTAYVDTTGVLVIAGGDFYGTFEKYEFDVGSVFVAEELFYLTGSGELIKMRDTIASSVAEVALSDVTTFYRTNTGDLYGTGANDQGQQGNGTTTDVTTFTKIASANVQYVVASDTTTFYRTSSGDLYGTGANDRGQQGNGTTTDVTSFELKNGEVEPSEPVDLSYTVTVGSGRVTLVQTGTTLLDVSYTVLYVNSTTGDYAAYLPTSSKPVYADEDSDIYLMGMDSWADGSPSGVSGSAGSTITASDYKGARQITEASPSGSYVVAPVGYTTTEQVVIGGIEASPMVKTMFGLLPVLMLVAVLLGIIRAYRQ